MPNARCPMPKCPMPNARCPTRFYALQVTGAPSLRTTRPAATATPSPFPTARRRSARSRRAAAASLEAVGSGVAGDLRKIRGDRLAEGKRERERVQSRQGKAQQNERWTQGNLSNERPQRRGQKLSNKHSVAKREEKQRKAQRSVGGWPQSKGKGKGKGKGR